MTKKEDGPNTYHFSAVRKIYCMCFSCFSVFCVVFAIGFRTDRDSWYKCCWFFRLVGRRVFKPVSSHVQIIPDMYIYIYTHTLYIVFQCCLMNSYPTWVPAHKFCPTMLKYLRELQGSSKETHWHGWSKRAPRPKPRPRPPKAGFDSTTPIAMELVAELWVVAFLVFCHVNDPIYDAASRVYAICLVTFMYKWVLPLHLTNTSTAERLFMRNVWHVPISRSNTRAIHLAMSFAYVCISAYD